MMVLWVDGVAESFFQILIENGLGLLGRMILLRLSMFDLCMYTTTCFLAIVGR